MAAPDLTTDQLDYLQRAVLRADRVQQDAPATQAPPRLRALTQVWGIGRYEKVLGLGNGFEGSTPGATPVPRLPSEDLLIGLYGLKIALAFVLHARPGNLTVHLGVWSPETANDPRAVLDERLEILGATLRSLYPSVDLRPRGDDRLDTFQRGGLVLGIPTVKPRDPSNRAQPVDRLIRALDGSEWAALVLAQPVDESVVTALRHTLLNESRGSQAAAESMRAPSPLARHYTQLLEIGLNACSHGLAVGMWRSAVYLLGHHNSYYRLASVWRGIFSGEDSLPEPIRVWDNPSFADLAQRWALLDGPAPQGPALYRHPFEYQTLLTSSQLSAYVHLPEVETGGFRVSASTAFDVVPARTAGGDTLKIGRILTLATANARAEDQNEKMEKVGRANAMPEVGDSPRGQYVIDLNELTKHVFIAGVTGSGKTNTIFHLLKEADARNVPFLVIEPAKSEYRLLLDDPGIHHRVLVFTLGNERVSPFRLNPFEIVPGISVSVHLDLLRSVFASSFGMWNPLPQILEQSLHEIYADYGWDITAGSNARDPGGTSPLAYPTLSALSTKVEEVIGRLGYDKKITDDFRAALRTRLNSLRTGGKGRMLDVQRSFPMEDLLGQPTVLELEGMGDDDDKAFIMGLLLIRLAEQRIAEHSQRPHPPERSVKKPQDDSTLKHLLVIEEAHRLLANVGAKRSPEEGDPRGKAVETFANLLSEIRSYGQGVIVADQVPVKLAPDIIKNTNLKLAHRVVAEDDRTTLAGAMVMNPAQCQALATLTKGQAVVFAESEDAPLLVLVDPAKGRGTVSDDRVVEHMGDLRKDPNYRDLFWPFAACAHSCAKDADSACPSAQRISESSAFRTVFARLILSTMEDPDAIDRLWPEIQAVVNAARPPLVKGEPLLRCIMVRASRELASRRGAQAGWIYRDTERFDQDMRKLLLAELNRDGLEICKVNFQQAVSDLHHRAYDPYPFCNKICAADATCLYRHFVADLVAQGSLSQSWREAEEIDSQRENKEMREELLQVCEDAAQLIIEWPDKDWEGPRPQLHAAVKEAAIRVARCFAQQMLASDARKLPKTTANIMNDLMEVTR